MKTRLIFPTYCLFGATLFFFEAIATKGFADEKALINGKPEPYVLSGAQYEKGLLREAIRATETAGYGVIPSTGMLNQAASFTLEAFVKMESPGTGSGIIAARRGPSSQDWQWWCTKDGTIVFQAYSAATTNVGYVTSSRKLSLNRWHHIGVSVDSGLRMSVYIDGVLDSQGALKESLNTSASSAIAVQVAGSGVEGRIFPGLIEDFRLYEGAISPQRLEEVTKLLGTAAP